MNRVLVVDDNPLILNLLAQALTPLAVVTTASDGVKALERAAGDPPDLVISDFNMPGIDGRALLEQLCGRKPRISVILMASRADIGERLQPVRDVVEEFLEKPFFIGEATARIKRVLDKIALEKMARAAPGQTTLRGSLAQMNVIDLVQSLELGRKTCLLTLTRGNERCQLFFNEGQLQHAAYGSTVGDAAVYKVLAWTDTNGNFQIDFDARATEQSITRSNQGLLMEGLRLVDEAHRDE